MTDSMNIRALTISLERRLPDINKPSALPSEYDDYGRIAVLKSGKIWIGGIGSSHPRDTVEGFYYALAGDTLYLSPRGYDSRDKLTDDDLRGFVRQIKLRKSYTHFRIVR